jgi:inosine/xanthosine triphosphatase
VKVRAVRNVMRELFGRARVRGVEVGPELPPQPIGRAAVIRGAIARAKRALAAGDFDLGVGIEAGLERVAQARSGYLDVQWCAVVDRRGRVTLGHGAGFEHPRVVIEEVLREEVEVGKVMERLTGIEQIGRRMGAIGYLSKGRLDRLRLTEQAVLMAMLPRLNPELYGLEGPEVQPP